MTLAEQFPSFSFAGTADQFLAAKHIGFAVMLASRRIARINVIGLFSYGGIGIAPDGLFTVKINDELPAREQAKVLGHEIAHTFHHDLAQTPPRNLWPIVFRDDLEQFCESFADQWVQNEVCQEAMQRFANEKTLITHCYLSDCY